MCTTPQVIGATDYAGSADLADAIAARHLALIHTAGSALENGLRLQPKLTQLTITDLGESISMRPSPSAPSRSGSWMRMAK